MHVRGRLVTGLGNRGLTLFEIMIALTITALIMSVVYGSLRAAGGSLQTLSVRNQLYRSTHALLEEMSRELASAFNRRVEYETGTPRIKPADTVMLRAGITY